MGKHIKNVELEKQERRNRLKAMFEDFGYFDIETIETETLEKEYESVNLKFKSAGGVVPVQAEGYIGDKYFYFRFRYDNARLMIGEYVDERSLPVNAETFEIKGYSGDSLNGYLTSEEFKVVFKKLLDMYLQK